MGVVKCSPGPWKAIENSWQYTTIYDAHDREICRLDLERFEDLNEETQDKYEAIQRADAAAIVQACDHLAALRRAKGEVWGEVIEGATSLRASVENGIPPHERVGFMRACNEIIGYARAAQIEEGEST